jgi:hypothetical protein
MGPDDLHQLSPEWLSPGDPTLVLSTPKLFNSCGAGLYVLFGPNNVGKTRLLRALAAGVWRCEIPSAVLREYNPEIQRFPGAEERDRWGRLPSVVVEWRRRDRFPVLSEHSTDEVRETVLSGRPNTDPKQLSALIAKHIKILPSRGARYVISDRFLPGAVPISADKFMQPHPNDESTPGRPANVSAAIADLHDSPDPADRARNDAD